MTNTKVPSSWIYIILLISSSAVHGKTYCAKKQYQVLSFKRKTKFRIRARSIFVSYLTAILSEFPLSSKRCSGLVFAPPLVRSLRNCFSSDSSHPWGDITHRHSGSSSSVKDCLSAPISICTKFHRTFLVSKKRLSSYVNAFASKE